MFENIKFKRKNYVKFQLVGVAETLNFSRANVLLYWVDRHPLIYDYIQYQICQQIDNDDCKNNTDVNSALTFPDYNGPHTIRQLRFNRGLN